MNGPFAPLTLAALLLLPGPSPARAAAPAEDPVFLAFQSAKDAIRQARWSDADVSLRRVAELLSAPGREEAREKALPAYHFYSALTAFELGDKGRATDSLARYFERQPGATIDPSAFPKPFVTFFEEQKAEAARHAPPPPAPGKETIAGTALPAYASRDLDTLAVPANDGNPAWADGAVSVLLSDTEREQYRTLPDDAARREWVARFWRLYDAPGEPAGSFQAEFYRRTQYCEANFSTEQTRGTKTDRGRVFLILGPPTFASRSLIQKSQDPMDIMRRSSGLLVTPGEPNGEAETWTYRQARIPKGIGYTELKFMFVTRPGYGIGVLQKDAREMNALQAAARLLRRQAPEER